MEADRLAGRFAGGASATHARTGRQAGLIGPPRRTLGPAPGRLPGLRVAAARAADRGRHRRLEHEPASACVERPVLGWTGLPRPAAIKRKGCAMAREGWAVDGGRWAVSFNRPAATSPPAARAGLVSDESNLHCHPQVTVRLADGFALAHRNPGSNATLMLAPAAMPDRCRVGKC